MDYLKLFEVWGIAGVIAWASVWLVKNVIDQILRKDIDKFKHALEKEAIEFKIRYEKLHYERADVVKEVYKKIVKSHESFHSLIRPMQWAGEPKEEDKAKNAAEKINGLIKYYEENRIFFEEDIASEVDNLVKEFKSCWIEWTHYKRLEEGSDKKMKTWEKAWKQIDKDIPNVKKLIEKKFRKIIGIEN